MSFLNIILISLVQGITEFLPISSSAHLLLLRKFLQIECEGNFIDVAAHLGSLLAVIWYYRKDIVNIIFAFFRGKWNNPSAILGFKLVVATLPIVFVGGILFLLDWDIKDAKLVIYTSVVAGAFLWIADVWGEKKRDFSKTSFVDALVVGGAQVLSIIPGVSRSGSTVTAGLFRGLKREAALQFSFMLAIPTVMLAFLSGVLKVVQNGTELVWNDVLPVVVFSAIFSFVSINVMMKLIHRCSFKWFGIYRIILGLILYFVLN